MSGINTLVWTVLITKACSVPAELYKTSLRLHCAFLLFWCFLIWHLQSLSCRVLALIHCTAVLPPSAERGEIPTLYMTDLGLHLSHSHTFPGANAAVVMMEWQGTNAQGTADGGLILVPPHCSRCCCDRSTWPSSESVRATHKSSWSSAIHLHSCGQFYLSPLKHRLGCRGSMANTKEVAKNCQRSCGISQGPTLLQGSSCPADMTGKKCNSSCSRRGNQLEIEVLVLCQWERRRTKRLRGRLAEECPQNRKMNGISRQEWVFIVIGIPNSWVW